MSIVELQKEPKIFFDLKYKPRENQIEALNFLKTNIRKGKRFFLLDMPTGSGKSYLTMMFINWYKNNLNKDAKFDLLTNTKILQNQYKNEFPFIADLKGKNAYMCNSYKGMTCQEGKEMNKALKRKCDDCPYDRAMSAWRMSDVSLTNYHLFDTLNLFIPNIMDEKTENNNNVLIIDEAHQFEEVLCNYISTTISRRTLASLGFSDMNIINIFREMKSINTIDKFVNYLSHTFINKVDNLLESLREQLSKKRLTEKDRIKVGKNISNITTALVGYENLVEEFNINPNNWVIDITRNDKKKDAIFPKDFKVQPVWSYKYLNELIYKRYDHIIFMSGTILDKNVFSFLNGIPNKQAVYYAQPSTFPLKNRPIYYIKKIGKMTYKEKEETWKKQIPYIKRITKKYSDKKGIIHTGNYEIAKWLEEEFSNDKRFIFHDSDTREEAYMKHTNSKEPTILVSPSMIEGISLDDDLSRFQIILKVPYPHLGSNRNKKRMEENKEWYGYTTVMDIIQALGRSIRSDIDYADSFILDASFSNILQMNYKYLPNYITEAIKVLK